MKQVLFLIFLFSFKTFSQSLELGDIRLLKNSYADKKNKELYIFYQDSLSIIDLVELKEKSKTKISYPNEEFKLGFQIVSVDSQIYFISLSGGLVYRLEGEEIVRIDSSFDHKMQINSTIFTYKDIIYRYGGYGFWSHRNFFTSYNKTTKDWKIISPTGSTSFPKGSQSSNITIVDDNIYVYGGYSLDKSDPLKYIENNEVWKFNMGSKSWDNLGSFEFNLSDFNYSIPYKNSHILIGGIDTSIFYLVDLEENLLKIYKNIPIQEKLIISLDSFYMDGVFYCYVREVDTENNIQLITINEDRFLSKLIKEETFYNNNEKMYYSIGIILLIVSSIPVYKKIRKEKRNKNKIRLENGNLIYKKSILPFDEKRISIISLLVTSDKEVSLNDIIDVYDQKELNYGHITRVINGTLEDINFLLKSILKTKEDLIIIKKSDLDKRIKVYSIDKSYFYLK